MTSTLTRGRLAIEEGISINGADPPKRKIQPAFGIAELLSLPDKEESWIAETILPTDGNFLIAGYPKTHKTNFVLEIAISAASATPFLGRFHVPRQYRVGVILMEDNAQRIRRRLQRICQAHDVELAELDGYLRLWFRPRLVLSDVAAMNDLHHYVDEYELDYLHIDNWSYVHTGNSNDPDEVTSQLEALRRLRDGRPGLVVGLTQHARKTTKDVDADRLTDTIRNSSAFGAWYDVGIVLGRENENAPVTVRTELRDHPSLKPFAMLVEDEFPAGPDWGPYPSGHLRLHATDRTAKQLQTAASCARYEGPVIEYLRANPGCSKRMLRKIAGDNTLVEAAFDALCARGDARFIPPEAPGRGGQCWLIRPDRADRAATVLTAQGQGTVLTVLPTPPLGGASTQHTPASLFEESDQ